LVLVMVRIDVDDEHVIELALLRLLAGVSEKPGGIELFDRDASAAVGDEFHGASPDGVKFGSSVRVRSPVRKRGDSTSEETALTAAARCPSRDIRASSGADSSAGSADHCGENDCRSAGPASATATSWPRPGSCCPS